MIGHLSSNPSFQGTHSFQKNALSPSQRAEKERIETRLGVLEEKMDGQTSPTGLDPAEAEQRQKLQARDSEVKAHEMAHQAAAGALSRGGMTLVYQVGPDGRSYAIGGSVQIDTSPGRTPEETIQKAQRIRASALAPADPSSQDVKVAAQASKMEAEARAEIGKRARKSNAGEHSESVVTSSKQVLVEDKIAERDSSETEGYLEESVAALMMQRVANTYGG